MKVSADVIKKELQAIWPNLEYIWLWDTIYWKGTVAQVERLMENSKVKTMEFIPEFNDCDDYALQFQAEVRRIRYFAWKEGRLPEEQRLPFAILFAAGTMFRGISKNHVTDLVLLQEGVHIVDMTPGEQRMWLATREQDDLYFVSS